MTQDALIDDLVLANRILAAQGVLDAFGHVSVRDPRDPSAFLLSRSRPPAEIVADDIRRFGFDGAQRDSTPVKPYLERFIHSEIYRARPDVHAVVHSHSPAVLPFGVTRTGLRPICHVSGFLGAGAALFDTQDRFGDTDLLIRDPAMGGALAEKLGDVQRGADCAATAPRSWPPTCAKRCSARSISKTMPAC